MASSRNSELPEPLPAATGECLRRNAVSPGQRLLLAFSGGRDSVALLHVLQTLREEFGYELAAVHVNHGISPSADDWHAFCEALCAKLGVPLTVAKIDVPRAAPEGLEAAARDLRYEVFSRMDADWVTLAHHRGDQAETLLFKLLRGAGLAGAAAMPEARSLGSGRRLLRPLLGVGRTEIDSYLQRQRLGWIEDESNIDTRYDRNFLRHEILPRVQSRFPAAEKKLAGAAAHFAEARQLLDELALIDLAGGSPSFPLPASCLTALSEVRARNLLRFLLAKHGVRIPSELRLTELLRQLREARPDRWPTARFGGFRIFRRRGKVHLEAD